MNKYQALKQTLHSCTHLDPLLYIVTLWMLHISDTVIIDNYYEEVAVWQFTEGLNDLSLKIHARRDWHVCYWTLPEKKKSKENKENTARWGRGSQTSANDRGTALTWPLEHTHACVAAVSHLKGFHCAFVRLTPALLRHTETRSNTFLGGNSVLPVFLHTTDHRTRSKQMNGHKDALQPNVGI